MLVGGVLQKSYGLENVHVLLHRLSKEACDKSTSYMVFVVLNVEVLFWIRPILHLMRTWGMLLDKRRVKGFGDNLKGWSMCSICDFDPYYCVVLEHYWVPHPHHRKKKFNRMKGFRVLFVCLGGHSASA